MVLVRCLAPVVRQAANVGSLHGVYETSFVGGGLWLGNAYMMDCAKDCCLGRGAG